MNTMAIIGCIVGVVSCVIGVSTFVSANLTKAKEDGMQIAKLDQCVRGIEEIRSSVKEKSHEVDVAIDNHSSRITVLETQMKSVFKQLNVEHH